MKTRWLIKRFMRLLPQKRGAVKAIGAGTSIGYIFSGTYGDFVQILSTLWALCNLFPKTAIFLIAPTHLTRAFNDFLPSGVSVKKPGSLVFNLLKPYDILLTNTISVFRIRFEALAYFCGRRTLGFCYGDETGRRAFSFCLRLKGIQHNFSELNLKLLDFINIDHHTTWADARECMAQTLSAPGYDNTDSLNISSVLFHIGSVNLKNNLGLKLYKQIIFDIISVLKRRYSHVHLVSGPGDEYIAEQLKSDLHLTVNVYTLGELRGYILNFKGQILCFDSFMAHFCYFLNRHAIVIHREAVPSGYHCSPTHSQIILKSENNWSLEDLETLLLPER
jgi:hypothetical protein